MKNKDHLQIWLENFYCANCGAKTPIGFPIAIKAFAKRGKAFEVLHIDCKLTTKTK